MHMKNTKSTKGFTLMELIIVLALLAIIAAILIPMFLNTTDRARLRSDIQSARVIQNAIDLYRIETSCFPVGANPDAIITTLGEAGYLDSRNAIPQTEGARWVIDDDYRVFIDITNSPQVRDLIENLSEADRQMVTGAGS